METLPDKFEAPMVKVSQATVETVKRTIFKDANDAELQLFFHKCLSVGCHPLDMLIHPSKFKGDGGDTVVFITSIDLMRSKAEETEEYDGQDPADFTEGEHGDKFIHPIKATLSVYRKGIDRPFVGEARWSEFFPSKENKQFMWKKMPYVMLKKCAEAQALRMAFPKKLNKLYAEEEMHQAIEAAAKKPSTKPTITQDTLPVDAELVEVGIIQEVTVKKGTGKKGAWTKYGININGTTYSTFDKKIADYAVASKGKDVNFDWKQDGKYKNLVSLSVLPPIEPEPKAEQPDQPKEEKPLAKEEFETVIQALALKVGLLDQKAIDKFIYNNSAATHKIDSLGEVPPELYSGFIDLFTYHSEKQE